MAGMGTHSTNAISDEEPHWKLSTISLQYNSADVTDDDNFDMALETNCQELLVCNHHTPAAYDICGVHSGKWQVAMDFVTLANCWQIPLHKAKNIVQQIMQHGMKIVLYPMLSRHFKTNNRMLHYHRMPCNLFSNTMFCPKVLSAQGYMMVQIFMTDFGWSQNTPCCARVKPMRPLVSFLHGKVSCPS
jgi:hypothetical protein